MPEPDDDPSFDEPFDAEEPDEAGNPFYEDDNEWDFPESDDDSDEDDLDERETLLHVSTAAAGCFGGGFLFICK